MGLPVVAKHCDRQIHCRAGAFATTATTARGDGSICTPAPGRQPAVRRPWHAVAGSRRVPSRHAGWIQPPMRRTLGASTWGTEDASGPRYFCRGVPSPAQCPHAYIEMVYNSTRWHAYLGYVSPNVYERLARVAELGVHFSLTITCLHVRNGRYHSAR